MSRQSRDCAIRSQLNRWHKQKKLCHCGDFCFFSKSRRWGHSSVGNDCRTAFSSPKVATKCGNIRRLHWRAFASFLAPRTPVRSGIAIARLAKGSKPGWIGVGSGLDRAARAWEVMVPSETNRPNRRRPMNARSFLSHLRGQTMNLKYRGEPTIGSRS